MPEPTEYAQIADANAALARLQSEMQVEFGPVPVSIEGEFLDDGDGFIVSSQEFLFTTWEDVRFHYRKGRGLTVQLPPAGLDTDFELFLWGTVFGTVAWLNDYVPLHASAVDVGGRVVAFTADSGGGKSTLAASLAARGLPHVCDDTLVVALQPNGVMALPDAKPLKLWDDALGLASSTALRPVYSMPGKNYADPARKATGPLPLTDLVFLERGEKVAFEPVTGAAKLALLPATLYRGFVHVARGDRALHEQFLMTLTSQVRVWRLFRPFDSHRFGEDVDTIKAILCGESWGG
ncbi:hypothetical protein GGQ88_001350 [Novosphingobium hassiacum]|uniref:Uncharacterized protein n=1 Tax=Novosphingobium hassiacum TaxID=173676 RepID=A0A7W6EVV2_9SPHN|nr:hypothetical protein [Novosphingobium hassiacum]MBB3860089.1 hypothetical protein [Novosphingobium hassiacum]